MVDGTLWESCAWGAFQRNPGSAGSAAATAAEWGIAGVRADVGALWLACDRNRDGEFWERFSVGAESAGFGLCIWKGRLVADLDGAEETTSAGLRRSSRVALHSIPARRAMEFSTSCTGSPAAQFPTLRPMDFGRSSGIAAALAVPEYSKPDLWPLAAGLMESHYRLSFDVENTRTLEQARAEIVGAYVNLVVEFGMAPIVSLNGHPYSGFAVFGEARVLDAVAEGLTAGAATEFDGNANIRRAFALGGAFAYV
ncbi:hypothetical protein [Embleya sp. NBC_00896]|uniref:hypothetical protein n=1 Tax=Embleya sp. NBC_00896 TaxID=2975961 RepID=UPI00386E33A2|nr:hypothetical protein OG928_29635 [Embleya sp. NBC_00896]